jgi:hypothetical protein
LRDFHARALAHSPASGAKKLFCHHRDRLFDDAGSASTLIAALIIASPAFAPGVKCPTKDCS